ncbi:hypothetical protein CRYUN_Cryun21dG0066600 [Craigia yunnanensis]
MGSEGPKAVTIHVTGFKKFQGVSENPTETIVNNLMSFVQRKGLLPAGVTLGSCTVLETAGNGALPVLYKVLESGISGTDSKNEQVIWLHLGVNSGAQKFAIEQQAVNEATFRCPGELGWQPQVDALLLILTNFLCCSINIYIIVFIISFNFYTQSPLCSFFVLKYVVLKLPFDVSSNSQLLLRMEELPGKERYSVIFLYILFTFVMFYPPLYQRNLSRVYCHLVLFIEHL